MDEYCTFCHWQNRTPDATVDEIKDLILAKATKTDTKALTDYLRIALGHMLLTSLSNGFAFDSEYAMMKTAYQLYVDRGFSDCHLNGLVIC